MGYESFRELVVWQEAKALAIEIYKITNQGMLKTDYGLRDQIQKSAVSIASNIAEGYERNSDKDFLRFLYIAKGSLRAPLKIHFLKIKSRLLNFEALFFNVW